MRFVTILCCIILFEQCAPPLQLISYHKKGNDIYINNRLKHFVKENPSPKIVLRVLPTPANAAASGYSAYNLLYSTMEKALLKEGFIVRDRMLFNAVFDKNTGTSYGAIQNNTDTDIIMEVLNIDTAVINTTDTLLLAYHKKQQKKVQSLPYRAYGAVIEYRLIMMKENDITAALTYYYTPCVDGCDVSTFTIAEHKAKQHVLKKSFSADNLTAFIQHSIKDISTQLRAD